MRLICEQKGQEITCLPGDSVDLSQLCTSCKTEALAHGLRHLAGAKPRAAKPARRGVVVMRAAKTPPTSKPKAKDKPCSCHGKRSAAEEEPDRGREQAEDADLERWVSTIIGALPMLTPEDLTDLPREQLKRWADAITAGAVKAARAVSPPRGLTLALAAKSPTITPTAAYDGRPPKGLTLALARLRSMADGGRDEDKAPASKKTGYPKPPRGISMALRAKAEAA